MPKKPDLMGKCIKVMVKSAKKHCLIAEIMNSPAMLKDTLQGIDYIYSKWPIFALIVCILARVLWLLI